MASETKTDIPAYSEFLWPTLQALRLLGNSGTVAEIDEKAVELCGLAPEQLSLVHKNGPQTEVRYRMAWARTYLRMVGAIENSSRGVWALTEYGLTMCPSDMASIPAQVRNMHRGPKTQLQSRADTTSDAKSPNDGTLEGVLPDESADTWVDRLLQVLFQVKPASFEALCQRVLRESGFTQVQITGRTGDGGIDGIGVLRVALLSFHVLFQCKRYKGSVGAPAIRDFRGAMVGRTDKGLFLTTGTFTAEAVREATRDGAPVIDLVDGAALCELLKETGLGVTTRMVEEVVIDADWYAGL